MAVRKARPPVSPERWRAEPPNLSAANGSTRPLDPPKPSGTTFGSSLRNVLAPNSIAVPGSEVGSDSSRSPNDVGISGDVRLGVAHLEATCDPGSSAICKVYAARWCQNPPKVYDRQKYFTGANGQERTVYLASCDPRV